MVKIQHPEWTIKMTPPLCVVFSDLQGVTGTLEIVKSLPNEELAQLPGEWAEGGARFEDKDWTEEDKQEQRHMLGVAKESENRMKKVDIWASTDMGQRRLGTKKT
jgi:hypothetical protein